MEAGTENQKDDDIALSFSHVHMYVDELKSLEEYKEVEDQLKEFDNKAKPHNFSNENIKNHYQTLWKDVVTRKSRNENLQEKLSVPFVPQGRDLVLQLLVGLGFRITAVRMPYEHHDDNQQQQQQQQHQQQIRNTRSVLVTSPDPKGVQFVITAIDSESKQQQMAMHQQDSEATKKGGNVRIVDKYFHFDESNLQDFFKAQSDHQGIAVLAFEIHSGSIQNIYERYQKMHPNLLTEHGILSYDGVKLLEVYAYYHPTNSKQQPDVGTRLRFLQRTNQIESTEKIASSCLLPGLTPVHAVFDADAQPAFCDHWVSNVISRTGFLQTLQDTLGFKTKVDFNAGVVAAGEAQIESTVTGNDSTLQTTEVNVAFRDQSQVYLPINNAISQVGHVHQFLQEIGQGVQHIASRVNDLVSFVQRCNDYRKITGEGFTFLNIPRSYYGVLTVEQLVDNATPKKHSHDNNGNSFDKHGATKMISPLNFIHEDFARTLYHICEETHIINAEGAVNLNMTRLDVASILDDRIPKEYRNEYKEKKEDILCIIMHSRYINLYQLLKEHISEKSYLGIVRNQILVDVQGEDLLFQIFTSNILQRKAGDEAPFLEFIQRVCSERKCDSMKANNPVRVKPGCGGFGIRNFLTLFLSIEVSKAMSDATKAKIDGDMKRYTLAKKMVGAFTNQLNESNPILTEISNAMTMEGRAQDEMTSCLEKNDKDGVAYWKLKKQHASEAKSSGNAALMSCSAKYKTKMEMLKNEFS